jgi:SpoVK/Ycf46/Vps4 family AAA+-type ATPase
MIIWHGPPGTGKTFALRALCAEWSSWCDVDYVVDPEKAFGHEADYLMELLLQDGESMPLASGESDSGLKWRLLILEDTGDLISEGAREKSGQGLSRLLNVADGFLGQGLKVLVLLTTNETIDKLHPAVSRPGRAARVVLFPELSGKDASIWAKSHGIPNRPQSAATLAELYAELENYAVREEPKRPFGFTSEVID